jgi:TolB-like protein
VFVLLQLGEIIFPAFGAPDWALRLLVVASFLGFPLVLALAWVFDLTASGIQRSDPENDSLATPAYSGTALPRFALLGIIIVSVAGVGGWAIQDTLGAQSADENPSSGNAIPASVGLDDTELQVRSLAVLPLEDFSEVEGGEYFTAGFHEELVSQLSQLGAARVISRTSVVQYDATGKSMPTIASDLGVEGVVEGSVFRDGDRVRITVQLIHGPTDQHLWANSYDGTLEDAIGLQRTVAQAIAEEIRGELFPNEEWETPNVRVASSPRVQEEYMKGRFSQAKATPESLEDAIVHFEAALEEDSTFAPAYAGLAGARLLLDLKGEDSQMDVLVDPGIVEPLEMAFQLDEESPEAQAVFLTLKGALGAIPDMKLPEGVHLIRDSTSLLEAEIALAATEFGRQLQRVVVMDAHKKPRRTRIDPAQRLENARRLQATSEFSSAEEEIRATIAEAPESEDAWEALEHLKAVQRDYAGATRVREERFSHSPQGPMELKAIEEMRRRVETDGETGYWSWRIDELEAKRDEGKEVSPVLLARAYAGLHRNEDALRELEAGVKARDRNLTSLWTDPAWDSLRGDPRFRSILAEVRRREPGLF